MDKKTLGSGHMFLAYHNPLHDKGQVRCDHCKRVLKHRRHPIHAGQFQIPQHKEPAR